VEKGHGCFENLHQSVDGGAFSRLLVGNAQKYYGAPMLAYLESLAAHTTEAAQVARDVIQKFEQDNRPPGCDGQVDRMLHRFAVVAAGGELATKVSLTGWKEGDAMEAAGIMFRDYIRDRGGSESLEKMNAIRQVKHFLERHQSTRFKNLNSGVTSKISNMAGWCDIPVFDDKSQSFIDDGLDKIHFYIQPEVFKQEVCRGMNYKTVAMALAEKGMLVRNGKHLTTPLRFDGSLKRVFHITGKIFE
jgi:uncharacterized protein (DUF927 family)